MTRSHNYKMVGICLLLTALAAGFLENAGFGERGGNLTTRTNDPRKQYSLEADYFWRLNPPRQHERFDASALVFVGSKLYTVNDRQTELHQIRLGTNHSAELLKTKIFAQSEVAAAAQRRASAFDSEGLAFDGEYLYASEESQRAVFRVKASGGTVERLKTDWAPMARYFKGGANASFEGIAVGDKKLYVANERQEARIIVTDLATGRVESSFAVDSLGFALGGPHYSDLAFHGGKLFVLDRNHRCILEVNPATQKAEAEYSFGQMELAEDFAYVTDYPTGTMEGLAVDDRYFWLVTDNNGKGRFKDRSDTRPTLFRCLRPGKR